MREQKVVLAPHRMLWTLDDQEIETFEKINNEKKVSIYLEADDLKDEIVPGADGKVTRCRTVNINGVQWLIPVQVKTKIPMTVKRELDRANTVKRRVQPGMRKYDRSFQIQLK